MVPRGATDGEADGAEGERDEEANADKALDIRLMLEAADRTRAHVEGRSAIYDGDGDSSLKVDRGQWPN